MGEIHVNDIDMGPVEWIEVKQLLNGASYVSIAWVSKVGDLGYGWSLQELTNTLRVRGDKKAECTFLVVICGIIQSKKKSEASVFRMDCFIFI